MDLPDVVDWMLVTGCRIGEALALRFGTGREGGPLLGVDAPTWHVGRDGGARDRRGPVRAAAAEDRRRLAVGDCPAGLRDRAGPTTTPRHERNETGLVLAASILGTPCDPSNVAGDLRQLLDASLGYDLSPTLEIELVAGRACTVAVATPRPPKAGPRLPGSEVFAMIAGGVRFRLSVDTETGVLLRVVKEVDGADAETVTFLDVVLDASLPDDLFTALS